MAKTGKSYAKLVQIVFIAVLLFNPQCPVGPGNNTGGFLKLCRFGKTATIERNNDGKFFNSKCASTV